METSNIMNVEGEQNLAAGASAPSTTASTALTAAVRRQLFFTSSVKPPRNTTPLQVCGSINSSQAVLSHTPFITPPHYHTHYKWAAVLSHPFVCHTPFMAPVTCTLSPGLHKMSADNIFEFQNVFTGVCSLLSYTVSSMTSFHLSH